MSQPPFSQLIQRLEKLVGAQLFDRTTRSVRLTPAGHVMQRNARAVVARIEQLLQEVRQAALGVGGTLCIGMAPTAACSPLASKLYAFREAQPEIQLDLREMNSNAMEYALRQRTIDVAPMRPLVMDSDIVVVDALEEPMLLAVRKDSPMGRRRSVELEEVADLPLIGYVQSVSPYFRQMLQAMFVAIKRRPRIVQESVLPTVLTLVEAGVGVAVVPWSASVIRDSALAFIPLSNPSLPFAQIILAKRADELSANLPVNRLVSAMRKVSPSAQA